MRWTTWATCLGQIVGRIKKGARTIRENRVEDMKAEFQQAIGQLQSSDGKLATAGTCPNEERGRRTGAKGK